jgi:hypothetical protein
VASVRLVVSVVVLVFVAVVVFVMIGRTLVVVGGRARTLG